MEKTVKQIERICIIGMAVLALVAGSGICVLHFSRNRLDEAGQEETPPHTAAQRPLDGQNAPNAAQLARRSDVLPDGLRYGCRLPVTSFKTKDGDVRSLNEYRGQTLVVLFWGSWCPYCDEALAQSAGYAQVLSDYPDTQLLLIDKLDADRGETVERAQEHLAQLGVPFESLYDEDLLAYRAYGVKQIPTVLVLDAQGRLRAMTAQAPASGEAMRALLEDALSGGAASTARFIRERMTGEDGGIYTAYMPSGGDSPAGTDVLSESQGLMMQVAVLTDDRELFERSLRFAQEKLQRGGVFCWYATREGKQAAANALIDDLRIYAALRAADARWGGYGEQAAALAKAIWEHNVSRGRLVGFYDFSLRRKGDTLPLFYIDLQALRMLSDDVPGFAAVADEAERVLLGGRVSDAFPLYYSSYDYKKKRYSDESMNTAEALMTLYHAACMGLAGQDAIDWLRERVVSGTLAARYGVDGEPVRGFEYDSTAAYAIAALIGAEARDADLYTAARNRMEEYHVTRRGELCGSFSDSADGSDIVAFDQLLPLIVYTATGDIVFD